MSRIWPIMRKVDEKLYDIKSLAPNEMKRILFRKSQLRITALVMTLTAVVGYAQEPQKPLNPAYEKLVQSLGDQSFQVREEAHAKLAEIGLSARRELAAGLRSPDLEIRSRVRRIYVDLMYEDFEQNLQRFIDDVDGQLEHDLPGWDLYQKKIGTNPEERKFFAAMVRAEAKLLRAIETRKGLAEQLQARVKQLQPYGNYTPTGPTIPQIESIATVMLGASELTQAEREALVSPVYNLLNYSQIKSQIIDKPKDDVGKRMTREWAEVAAKSRNKTLGLMLILNYGFEETGLKVARELLGKTETYSTSEQYAAICAARFGGASEVELLLPLLTQTTLVHSWSTPQAGGKLIKTQLRDTALIMLLHLTKQNPEDYGYRFSRPSPTYIYEVYSCGFTEDENRDKAHTKWNTWWNDNGQTWLKENGKSESPDESK